MAKHAEDITLKLGGDVLAKAQSMTMPEVGTVVDETALGDKWKSNAIADLSWSMTTDHLWVPSDTAYLALRTAFTGKSTIAVDWHDDDGKGRSGTAVISGMEVSTRIGESVTGNFELTGTGPIVDNPGGS